MTEEVTELEAPDPTLSTLAEDSTYAEATDVPEQNPPDGPHTVQTLGKPGSGAKSAKKSSSSEKASSSSS